MMSLEERIEALVSLGDTLDLNAPSWVSAIHRSEIENPWFSQDMVSLMLSNVISDFFTKEVLEEFSKKYDIKDQQKRIGLILAGNIPMVGLHDLLCVYLSGNIAIYKPSDKDAILLETLLEELHSIEPKTKTYFQKVNKLQDLDAAIATGSNNSALHFAYYFKNIPHIIRKNRNAVAVITGVENKEDYEGLADDIFSYYGLGCRNVSKIYCVGAFPKDAFYEAQEKYSPIINHSKYKNNYDYNYAIYLLNKMDFLTNNVLISLRSEAIQSRIGSIHYEEFDSLESIRNAINEKEEEIQVVVSKEGGFFRNCTFGQSQKPSIFDYADGVDTMAFLTERL